MGTGYAVLISRSECAGLIGRPIGLQDLPSLRRSLGQAARDEWGTPESAFGVEEA